MAVPKGMLGRYEYSDGSSNKFWSIERTASGDYEARWGRIGTAGQGPKVYSEGEAYAKITEKISKGYKQVRSVGEEERSEAAWEARKKRRNKEIEEAESFMSELKKV